MQTLLRRRLVLACSSVVRRSSRCPWRCSRVYGREHVHLSSGFHFWSVTLSALARDGRLARADRRRRPPTATPARSSSERRSRRWPALLAHPRARVAGIIVGDSRTVSAPSPARSRCRSAAPSCCSPRCRASAASGESAGSSSCRASSWSRSPRSASSACSVPTSSRALPETGATRRCSLLLAGLACYGYLALRALDAFLLTQRLGDALVVVGLGFLAASLIGALMYDFMELGWWLGHGFELVGIVARRRPRRARPPPRAPSRTRSPAARPPRASSRRRRRSSAPASARSRCASPTRTPTPRSTRAASRCSPSRSARSSAFPRAVCAASRPAASSTTSASSPSPTGSSRSRARSRRTSSRSSSGTPSGAITCSASWATSRRPCRRLVLDHHERLDGSGYPARPPRAGARPRDPHPRRLRRVRRAHLDARLSRRLDARAGGRAPARGRRRAHVRRPLCRRARARARAASSGHRRSASPAASASPSACERVASSDCPPSSTRCEEVAVPLDAVEHRRPS